MTGSRWTAARSFLALTRPVFLMGGVLMYAIGCALAVREGIRLDWGMALLGQLTVTATQLVAQYANEHFDLAADRLNADSRTWFSGGSGVLAAGRLREDVAFRAAYVCLVASALLILALAIKAPLAGVLGGLALAGAWFYSAPPVALMGSGWGELAASAVVTVLTPLLGYVVQAGRLVPPVLLASLPLLLFHTAMMVTFNLADRHADTVAGKRTLVVRWGVAPSVLLHTALIAAGFAVLPLLRLELPGPLMWPGLALGVLQAASVGARARSGRPGWRFQTLGAVGLFVLLAGLLLVAVAGS